MQEIIVEQIGEREIFLRNMPLINDVVGGNYVIAADSLLNGTIILYSGIRFSIPEIDNIFDMQFDTNVHTSRLYLNSLNWLAPTLYAYEQTNDEKYKITFEKYLRQFLDYLDKNSEDKITKFDHGIWFRTCIFLNAIQLFSKKLEQHEGVLKLLLSYGDWCFDDSNHSRGNHGVMCDFCLLHLGVFFVNNAWIEKAVKRVTELFNDSFNSKDVNYSYYYYYYNIGLYKNVVDFCGFYKIDISGINLEKFNKSWQYFLWPDGGYPPIGDSSVGNKKFVGVDEYKTFLDSGYAFIKNDDFYLSLKCGWTEKNHKHLDDSSITLRYKGIDLILDSEKYNYSNHSETTTFGQRASAQSGFYPAEMLNAPSNVYFENIKNTKIVDFQETYEFVSVTCEYEYMTCKATRKIVFDKYNCISIIDSWNADIPIAFTRRLTLPDTMSENELTELEEGTLFHTKSENIVFCVQTTADVKYTTETGKGHYSANYNKKEDIFLLDAVTAQSSSGTITTIIVFKEAKSKPFKLDYIDAGTDVFRGRVDFADCSVMLNGKKFSLYEPHKIFSVFPKEREASHYLHIMSLRFLFPMLDQYERLPKDKIFYIVRDSLKIWLKLTSQKTKREYFRSEDHLMYITTVFLLKSLQLFDFDIETEGEIIGYLRRQSEWLFGDYKYTMSNHGTMQDYGLLYVAVYFDDERMVNKALSRLERTIAVAFDDDGLCQENTPTYHEYNIKLFNAVVNFIEHYRISDEVSRKIVDKICKAQSALSIICWQNTGLPPIGDGTPVEQSSNKSINGTVRFSHFFVSKTDETYFSLNCGYTSNKHKHLDETSITLRHKGMDFIVDSGYRDYDYTHPITAYLRHAPGHSAVFPLFVDELDVATWLKECSDAQIFSCMINSETDWQIECGYTIRDIVVRRSVIRKDSAISILDGWECKNPTDMRVRFALNPNVTLTLRDDRTIKILNGEAEIIIKISSEFETKKGWYSNKKNMAIENDVIDVISRQSLKGEVETFICLSNEEAPSFPKQTLSFPQKSLAENYAMGKVDVTVDKSTVKIVNHFPADEYCIVVIDYADKSKYLQTKYSHNSTTIFNIEKDGMFYVKAYIKEGYSSVSRIVAKFLVKENEVRHRFELDEESGNINGFYQLLQNDTEFSEKDKFIEDWIHGQIPYDNKFFHRNIMKKSVDFIENTSIQPNNLLLFSKKLIESYICRTIENDMLFSVAFWLYFETYFYAHRKTIPDMSFENHIDYFGHLLEKFGPEKHIYHCIKGSLFLLQDRVLEAFTALETAYKMAPDFYNLNILNRYTSVMKAISTRVSPVDVAIPCTFIEHQPFDSDLPMFVISCDVKFLQIYAVNILLNIAGANKHHFHIHVIGEEQEVAEIIEKFKKTYYDEMVITHKLPNNFPSLSYGAVPEKVVDRKTFYAMARFVFAKQIMERFDTDIFIFDADMTIVSDCSGFFKEVKTFDFFASPTKQFPKKLPSYRRMAGSVFIRNNSASKKVLDNIVAYYLTHIEKDNIWTIDQIALAFVIDASKEVKINNDTLNKSCFTQMKIRSSWEGMMN